MKISKQWKDGKEFLVLDEDPGMRELYEKETGETFPRTLTYQSNIDGHLQSWWISTAKTEMLLQFMASMKQELT